MAKLIKIDKNGSKHYEGKITCDRCQGRGWFATGVNNGQLVPSRVDNAVCWKCGGVGTVLGKWIERTPEYQAKLDARRQARHEAAKAKAEAEAEERRKAAEAKAEAERLAAEAEAARIAAQKAISKHVGEVGKRYTTAAVLDHTAWFEVDSFRGFGKDTVYIHTFKDAEGNVLIWKTSKGLGIENIIKGDAVEITGTVKEHNEYKDEKQTVLTRCKIKKAEA